MTALTVGSILGLSPCRGRQERGAAVSVVRAELAALVELLHSAVAPDGVRLIDGDDDDAEPATVAVRALALNRVGRSRRAGPVLDLELAVSVICTGDQRLENLEKLMITIEGGSRYSTSALDRGLSPTTPAGIGFQVQVPVSISIEEPKAPLVREPLQVKMQVGRQITGVVIDTNGNGLGGARVRSAASSVAVTCDQRGRFECFSTADTEQLLTVEFKETTKQFTANARMLPITLRWDGKD